MELKLKQDKNRRYGTKVGSLYFQCRKNNLDWFAWMNIRFVLNAAIPLHASQVDSDVPTYLCHALPPTPPVKRAGGKDTLSSWTRINNFVWTLKCVLQTLKTSWAIRPLKQVASCSGYQRGDWWWWWWCCLRRPIISLASTFDFQWITCGVPGWF